MLKLNAFTPQSGIDYDGILRRRQRALAPAYELFYQDPLHLVRGDGVWLYDIQGHRYLDAYNNVPSVGHSNPVVVEAVSRQAATLCTHTRYLDSHIVRLSERLIHTLPDARTWKMFYTCSGSEANDLALRLAFRHTKARGLIVTDHAYHGLTAWTAATSTSMSGADMDLRESGLELAVIRSPAHAPADCPLSTWLAREVRTAMATLSARGVRPAAILLDSFFTSDGGFYAPAGFLKEAVDLVQAAGGLYIADEVQAGFGRSGRDWWGFSIHGVVPDIVTMGKPMGNGYPMAGLAVSDAVADHYGDSYFNTFGGNTVAAAVGNAVLDEIETRDLMARARLLGEGFLSRLTALQSETPWLGDVRGCGLSLAVDILDEDGRRSAAHALALVNHLRRQGVLISTAGRDGASLKIRPMLIYKESHCDTLVTALAKGLHALSDPTSP